MPAEPSTLSIPPPPSPSGPSATPWGLKRIFLALLLLFPAVLVALLVFAVVVFAFQFFIHAPSLLFLLKSPLTTAWLNFISVALLYLAILALLFLLARTKGHSTFASLGFRKVYWPIFLAMPPLAMAFQFISDLFSSLLSPTFGGLKNPQTCQLLSGFGPASYLGFIAVVLIAPLVEETAFRGFLYGGLRSKYGIGLAATISALLFMIAHVLSVGTALVLLGPPIFVLGLLLALLYEKTKSILPGMLLHASFNAVAFFLIFAASIKQAHC